MKKQIFTFLLFLSATTLSIASTAVVADGDDKNYAVELTLEEFNKISNINSLYKNLEQNVNVASYTIEYTSNGFVSSDNLEKGKLPGSIKKSIVENYKAGQKITITNVKNKEASGSIKDIKGIIITLK